MAAPDPLATRDPDPGATAAPDDPLATHTPDAAATGTPAPAGGYVLGDEIARGGIGVVYRAADTGLGREVAVKVLQDRFGAASGTARRFADEARITGRLSHPGIPPVHAFGTLPDGRPFLAMKLIKGDTLAELLARRPDPAAERGRFVAAFEQVCQAVGYAHSQGVIHRDLKPANVMVGAFGEVQVMDWGLARDGTDEGRMTNDEAPTRESSFVVRHSSLTQAGAVMGTPAFMPPEQARGDTDRIDARSDVFGLGAVLAVVLTGQPPFAGPTAETTWAAATRGEVADCFARLDRCGAEPELIGLCRRCLSPDPAGRPADGGEVARAVAGLRQAADDRARRAELERTRAEVRAAEERKRRRARRLLVAAGLAIVAGLAAVAWRAERAETARAAELQARRLTTERDVLAALNEAEALRAEGARQADDPARWALTLTAARSAHKRAAALLAAGDPTDELTAAVAAAAAGLDADDRDRALLAELDRIADENDIRFIMPVTITDRVSVRYAAAFRAAGIDPGAAEPGGVAAWLKGHRFRDRLTAAVRAWRSAAPLVEPGSPPPAGGAAPPRLRDRLRAVLLLATDDPFTREWWAAAERPDEPKLRALLTRPEVARMSARELGVLAEGLADGSGGTILAVQAELARVAYERAPGEFWAHMRLGFRSSEPDDPEIIRHFTAAVAARPRSVAARLALGMALKEARPDSPDGGRLVRSAVELDPASPWPHILIGTSGAFAADYDETVAALRRAVQLDADLAFFMITVLYSEMVAGSRGVKALTPVELARACDELIAARPDHPGGYDFRAKVRVAAGDNRGALADLRASAARPKSGYAGRSLSQFQHVQLEQLAGWEAKLPAVLRGELRPATPAEWFQLARYCATFEHRYALAVRFATEAGAERPTVDVVQAAGWAVQAGFGLGADGPGLSVEERARLRRQALDVLRTARTKGGPIATLIGPVARTTRTLAPTRDPVALAALPADEREGWVRFWAELAASPPPPPPAPPPREVKR
ncbi:serine/threonine-protein kinase [Urbifossiella limnaea]|uniref:Serine/threonine-protein kinase PknB n=1 Tax=Urbifossiella limnaea TaxID=2528023 RepID=A0A517XL25_9BACT|nr:serine/threonine-protein kinase [Urbifossiella limnaea]QDU18205.1 Serine/threonine-protein kinase PknB [Urbifossiella limnaea]